MRGTIVIISPTGTKWTNHLQHTPSLETLQQQVGGFIEMVHGFKLYHHDGQPRDCVAFCNEDGKLKGLDLNTTATQIWQRQYPTQDVLVGPVVILFGDDEFMGEL